MNWGASQTTALMERPKLSSGRCVSASDATHMGKAILEHPGLGNVLEHDSGMVVPCDTSRGITQLTKTRGVCQSDG